MTKANSTTIEQSLQALALPVLLVLAGGALAQSPQAQIMKEVRFEQRMGETIPLDLSFRDSSDAAVQLADYFDDKPVILSLVYFECPMLCTLELNGLVRSLKTLDMKLGQDFTILTVSFDPGESPQLAARKRRSYLRQLGDENAADGWHFLTGDEPEIRRLCDSVGFHPVYDPQRDEYAHASGLILLTPQGRIARYLFGIDYPSRDLRLGLVETSAGDVGTATDQLLLLCYGYDPTTGKYGLVIMNVIRLGGLATLITLGVFIGASLYRDFRRSQQRNKAHH